MIEPNFAEIQRKIDQGDLTLEQCRRMGRTHAAYGWSAKGCAGPQWTDEQRAAYKEGHNDDPNALADPSTVRDRNADQARQAEPGDSRGAGHRNEHREGAPLDPDAGAQPSQSRGDREVSAEGGEEPSKSEDWHFPGVISKEEADRLWPPLEEKPDET